MSVAASFETFLQNLNLTPAERERASGQQMSLRDLLRDELGSSRDFLTGSYARSTAIRPLHDIDLFIVMPGPKPIKPESALSQVFSVVKRRYPQTKRKTQARSIGLEFAGTGISFDLVPAYETWGGYGPQTYEIPDRRADRWIRTAPEAHKAALTEANQRAGNKLVPLIKAAKQWNYNRGKPLRSFHLEVMSYSAFSWAPSSYLEGLVALFEHAARQVGGPCPDPARVGPDIDEGWTYQEREAAKGHLESAASSARRAHETFDSEEAHRQLEHLFGDAYRR